MLFKATVMHGSKLIAIYKGELGTVRRKGLAKVRQMAGHEAAKGRRVMPRDAMNWGDCIVVRGFVEVAGERVVPWDMRLTSTVTLAR